MFLFKILRSNDPFSPLRWRSVVQLEGLLVHFGKNAVAASIESLFLYKNEKDELGIQVSKRAKLGYLFSKFERHFVKI